MKEQTFKFDMNRFQAYVLFTVAIHHIQNPTPPMPRQQRCDLHLAQSYLVLPNDGFLRRQDARSRLAKGPSTTALFSLTK
ncbi:hypothetical protein ColTof4_11337 [Colletotrichum tofieldiae]|nr:hypothetical protein ColTof3_04523 [Colletotrichum tofieldiae]GKT78914.1 hypothetical protein ColTof4_11337 [Colletotrichum tofieldiae]